MFTPTAPLFRSLRRLRLTTKQGPNKGYYKGNRTGTVGKHVGPKFVVHWSRVRTYVVPAAEPNLDLKLFPFVAKQVEEPKSDPRWKGFTYAQIYLQRWKEENGED